MHIVCVNWRNYCDRGAEYVNILFDMVRRNLAEGFEGQFECFTDDPAGLDPRIVPRELPKGPEGWYQKLSLFRRGLFPEGDRVFFLDLDTLITGRLDEIAKYDGDFAILGDLYQPVDRRFSGWQSAVMGWRAGFGHHLWEEYEALGYPDVPGGDQVWIRSRLTQADLWQLLYPGLIQSYKATQGRLPAKASIVCFHGKPRPHDVHGTWVEQVWKIGGFNRADLDKVCNTQLAELIENVRISCSRPFHWLDTAPPHEGHAVLVGGGPSINDRVWEIQWRRDQGQSIWALNGSAKWLRDHDIIPTYHVIADARKDNVRFLEDRHFDTKYLIASQCHPSLLDKLHLNDTQIWHANVADLLPTIEAGNRHDQPLHLFGGGSTVGLNAICLAYGLGYRKFHLYGFDSSYKDGHHHAYEQALNDADYVATSMVGGRTFQSAPWMVQQAQEFERLAAELIEEGCFFSVHGEGLLEALARDMMANPRRSTADDRVEEVISRLNGAQNLKGAEIGVFSGDMSRLLLSHRSDLFLYMVDAWEPHGDSYRHIDGAGDWHARLSQEDQDNYMRMADERTRFAADRRKIIKARSVDAAADYENQDLDFVFIDADHSYEGCKADIEAWAPKLKPGGLLSGHDYDNPNYPKFGVTRAVNEFVQKGNHHLELGDNFTWFVRL